jgi:hypothetical protein
MGLELFAGFMVISLGLMIGTGCGLGIGYAFGKQKPEWSGMTLREKQINFILVVCFITLTISGLALYALPQ